MNRISYEGLLLAAVLSIDATLYLIGKDGVAADETKISSRFYDGRENGAVGSVAMQFGLKIQRAKSVFLE